MGTRLMLHWSDIAIEQEAASHLARREIEATMKARLAAGQGLELDRELKRESLETVLDYLTALTPFAEASAESGLA